MFSFLSKKLKIDHAEKIVLTSFSILEKETSLTCRLNLLIIGDVMDNTMYCIAPAANCNTVAMNNDKQGWNIIYYIWLI